jgi:2-methylaconitate cis-trans-isomerase PrpF
VASRVPGSIPAELNKSSGPTRIAHPSGVTLVDAGVSVSAAGAVQADYGAVYRSARRLFEGHVVYRKPEWPPSKAEQ